MTRCAARLHSAAGNRRGCAMRVMAALLGLLAVAMLVALGLWMILLGPYGYTPPVDAPGFDDGFAQPVFVYGSLRNSIVRRVVIGRTGQTRAAVLPGYRKELLNIVPDPQTQTRGEVIKVQAEELRRMDRYERLGVRYERVWLPLDDGSFAWVYRRLATP